MTLHGPSGIPFAQQRSALSRLAFIVGIFALAGPPVGGLTNWLLTVGSSVIAGYGLPYRAFDDKLPAFILYGYPLGILPAFTVGLAVAISAIWFGRTSFIVALVAVLIVNAIIFAVAFWFNPTERDFLRQLAIAFLPASFVASIVCWLLARRLLRTA